MININIKLNGISFIYNDLISLHGNLNEQYLETLMSLGRGKVISNYLKYNLPNNNRLILH